uniref:Uncharacterized protein n=1 Tax=Ixodes ricinus TaxID=34613 RepID=A0A6B0USR4_IXORI
MSSCLFVFLSVAGKRPSIVPNHPAQLVPTAGPNIPLKMIQPYVLPSLNAIYQSPLDNQSSPIAVGRHWPLRFSKKGKLPSDLASVRDFCAVPYSAWLTSTYSFTWIVSNSCLRRSTNSGTPTPVRLPWPPFPIT